MGKDTPSKSWQEAYAKYTTTDNQVEMNNVVLTYEGYTISIASQKHAPLIGPTKEIAVWRKAYGDKPEGKIEMIAPYGDSLETFETAMSIIKYHIHTQIHKELTND